MLTRDVEASRDYYAAGDYARAREKLLGSIWNCVECHSLQPSARRFEMAERLLDRVEFEHARPHEQALFSVLARRMPARSSRGWANWDTSRKSSATVAAGCPSANRVELPHRWVKRYTIAATQPPAVFSARAKSARVSH